MWTSSSTGNFRIAEHEEWWKIVHELKCAVIPAVITIDGMPRSDGGILGQEMAKKKNVQCKSMPLSGFEPLTFGSPKLDLIIYLI